MKLRTPKLGIATGDDQRAAVRREGFLSTIGHDVPTAYVPAPSSLALGRQALSELLAKDPGIQAIYCSSDQLAQGVVVEALARGLRIPQDLAVCGFGDADFAAHMEPSLTTVQVDGRAHRPAGGAHPAGAVTRRGSGTASGRCRPPHCRTRFDLTRGCRAKASASCGKRPSGRFPLPCRGRPIFFLDKA
ncbi:substrate-binding domain-containing protein [Cupriavidus necator]|uniref:substrate-binding domain-containing protein n=1 Tax=Cupriavidus necator TaxID=106590 RepID=UPI00339D7030